MCLHCHNIFICLLVYVRVCVCVCVPLSFVVLLVCIVCMRYGVCTSEAVWTNFMVVCRCYHKLVKLNSNTIVVTIQNSGHTRIPAPK